MNKLPNVLPKSINELPTEISLQINSPIEIKLGDICWSCGGTGKHKAMTKAMTFDVGAVRHKDVQLDCKFCDGTGRK